MLQICVCGDGNFVIVLNTYCKQVRINLFPEIFFVDDITEQIDCVYRKAFLTSLFKYD